MNDRYLYSAKRIDNEEWAEGYLVYDKFDHQYRIVIELDYSTGTCFQTMMAPRVDVSTICQCTAVPDRDNTIMFENDVVRESNGVRGVIRFGRYGDEKTDYGFYIEWEKSQPYWRNDIYYWQNELMVIGSYIDNPELLDQ